MGIPIVNVAGLASIYVSGSLFGYTQDGARITTEGHAINIPGDENGGDDGPPVEIQYLGETARVRLEMTKWDPSVQAALESRLNSGTPGTPGVTGTLVFTSGAYYRLTIASPITPRNFPCATLERTPMEINKGTKYSRLIVEFECYKNPVASNGAGIGVLWNTATA